MTADELLGQVTIPAPCNADWGRMHGDDRVRHCAGCGKHVYNLSAMTSDQAVALVHRHGDGLCGRFCRRPDGTIATADGTPRLESPERRWQFRIRSIMVVVAGIAAALGLSKRSSREPAPLGSPAPSLVAEDRPRSPAPAPMADRQDYMMGLFMISPASLTSLQGQATVPRPTLNGAVRPPVGEQPPKVGSPPR